MRLRRNSSATLQPGRIKIEINQRYSHAGRAQAHRDLESRKTTGSSIFVDLRTNARNDRDATRRRPATSRRAAPSRSSR
jgi:hypothetical protein